MHFKKIIMVLLLGLIFASPICGQPIAYVNGTSKAENPSSNSIAASAQNHTGGNLLVVVVGGSGSVSVSSVTDTAGNTYSSCNTRALYVGVGWCEIWYAKNITGKSSNVVTARLSASTTYRTIHVLQFSGCDILAPYDVGNTRTGNSSSQSTNPATTTQANELMVAGYRESVETGSFTAGTNPFQFTLSDQTTPRLATEYRLDTGAAGSYGSSMTYSKSNKWAASHATFRKQTDLTPPNGTIAINSGAALTNSTAVTLTLSCSDANGCSQMQISNDNITYSTPEAYSTTKEWTLTSGDGTKTVYVKFKDTPGNWSSAFSDEILLDATPPITNPSPAGGNYASAQSVTLSCNDGSGSGCDKIYYTTDGSTPTTTSHVYSSPINISRTTTLKFFATDLAGNSEAVRTEIYTIAILSGIAYGTKIGIFHDGTWQLDLNGNHTWDLPGDMLLNFGQAGDKPVTGDWDGSGTTKVGVFRDGIWKIDLNGSGLWEWEGDRIYSASLNSSSSFNDNWTLVPGSAASSPALAWNPVAKKMQIVVRRAGDTIYAGSFNSSGVFNNDWTVIPGTALSTPALAWNPEAQKMQIVVRRAGDTIYAGTFSSSGVFNNDWTLIPGTTLSSPAIAWNDSLNRMQIVAQGGSNAIYSGYFSSNGVFLNNWDTIPGTAGLSSPVLAWNRLAFRMQVVARGTGDTIYAGSFNSAGAFNNDWTPIPGATLSSPALAWNPLGFKMQIVVRGANDTLNVGSFNSMAAFNNDWATIPGNTLSSPAIAWNEVTKTMQVLSYGPKDAVFTFGMAGDIPVTGDWDGSGTTKIGVFRNGSWFLDLNGNGLLDPEDGSFTFGQAGDVPVTGDWNGSGITKIGVFRNGSWFLDLNGNGLLDPEDGSFTFGQAGDVPVTGDWDGSGSTKIGVFRNGSWFLDMNGNGVLEYPGSDAFYTFGLAGDTPVTTEALQAVEIDNLLKSMWTSMNNSLASGDIQTALLYITPTSKPSYEVMFNALIGQMPSILATHREFNLIYIKSKEAKYELVALEDGELHSYDVIFTKHENNVWGIDDF